MTTATNQKLYRPVWLSKYRYNDGFVFKSCGNYIVILQKLSNTKTNETRSVIHNRRYAKCRGDMFRVVDIVYKFDPCNATKNLISVQNTSFAKKITYEVDKIVSADRFDNKLDTIYSHGIHYFCSYKAAFFFEFDKWIPYDYTGKHYAWYDDGSIMYMRRYVNGI
jgi:hypothetical protein